ncbi:LXG domain-containing protein, partial [Aquibacillus rhizosphaerae]
MKVLDSKALVATMNERQSHYRVLRGQLAGLKRDFQGMIYAGDFQGQGADAIKDFYRAQVDVVEAWLRLVDHQIAFLRGIKGALEQEKLGGNTVVHTAFLEEDVQQGERQADDLVTAQRNDLEAIFRGIDDIITLDTFSRNDFNQNMSQVHNKRRETLEAVEQLDEALTIDYKSSEEEESYAVRLFQSLQEATSQGGSISPIHFNAKAYHQSEVYQIKAEQERRTEAYLHKQRQGEQTSVEDIVLISNTALQTLIGQKVSQIPYNVMTTEIVQDRVKAAKSAKASMEVMKNILLDEAKKMGVKTTNSVLEIFSTIVNDHIERSDKTFDSVGDFGNAMTFGVPKGIY